jgi:hypothetical protein
VLFFILDKTFLITILFFYDVTMEETDLILKAKTNTPQNLFFIAAILSATPQNFRELFLQLVNHGIHHTQPVTVAAQSKA